MRHDPVAVDSSRADAIGVSIRGSNHLPHDICGVDRPETKGLSHLTHRDVSQAIDPCPPHRASRNAPRLSVGIGFLRSHQ